MFGWVDYSEADRKRAAEVMNLARYPGAIDELGIGVLRDAFADKLFPATSTLHTHAKYYYLVAYLMKYIEREGAGKSAEDIRGMVEEGEMATCRLLMKWRSDTGTDVSGITGSDVIDRHWVKMTPASMNWAALLKLGFCDSPNLRLKDFINMVAATDRPKADDPEISLDSASSRWSVPYDSFKSWKASYESWKEGDEGSAGLSLWLTPKEASDLSSRIESIFPGTAYSALLRRKDDANATQNFVELVDSKMLADDRSEDLSGLCEIAADFSSFVAMLHMRFNRLLCIRAGIDQIEHSSGICWDNQYGVAESPYHERACKCDIEAVNKASGIARSKHNDSTLKFLADAHKVYSENPDQLDDLLLEREKSIKGPERSKLANAKEYAGNWYGGLYLNYRLEVAQMVVREITQALGGEHD